MSTIVVLDEYKNFLEQGSHIVKHCYCVWNIIQTGIMSTHNSKESLWSRRVTLLERCWKTVYYILTMVKSIRLMKVGLEYFQRISWSKEATLSNIFPTTKIQAGIKFNILITNLLLKLPRKPLKQGSHIVKVNYFSRQQCCYSKLPRKPPEARRSHCQILLPCLEHKTS